MKKFIKIFVLVFVTFYITDCKAQKTKTGTWFSYVGNNAFNNKLNLWTDIQYRNYNVVGDLQQFIFRTGIGYNLTENNNNILLGYAFVHTENYLANKVDKINTIEHRIFQQFITKQNFGKIYLQHRYRIEERFLQNNFQWRFRYSLSLNVPLNSKKIEANTWYAATSNEIYLNKMQPIFDRNRLYAGIGYFFNTYIKAEVGFMAQSLEKTNRNQLMINFTNNLPLHK
jgi:Protein of unknown function (DUF2490)